MMHRSVALHRKGEALSDIRRRREEAGVGDNRESDVGVFIRHCSRITADLR